MRSAPRQQRGIGIAHLRIHPLVAFCWDPKGSYNEADISERMYITITRGQNLAKSFKGKVWPNIGA